MVMGPSYKRVFERDVSDNEGCERNQLHLCSAYDTGDGGVAQRNQQNHRTAAMMEKITQRSVEDKEPQRMSTDDPTAINTTNRIPRIVHQSSKYNITTILVRIRLCQDCTMYLYFLFGVEEKRIKTTPTSLPYELK